MTAEASIVGLFLRACRWPDAIDLEQWIKQSFADVSFVEIVLLTGGWTEKRKVADCG